MSILDFLGWKKNDLSSRAGAQTETVRKIVQALDRLDPERAKFLASFAYILGRVAHADLHISDEETQAMERIVTEYGGLPEEQAMIVVQMAKSQNVLFGSTENFLVTREFSNHASREQKMALLHCLFAVSSSDQTVSMAEDREIRQIAGELKLEHKDFIEVRQKYREHHDLFKKTDH